MGKRKRSVRVFVQDGPTLQGVLVSITPVAYVLWAARIIQDGAEPVPLDGHVEVPRERVLYYQVIEG